MYRHQQHFLVNNKRIIFLNFLHKNRPGLIRRSAYVTLTEFGIEITHGLANFTSFFSSYAHYSY